MPRRSHRNHPRADRDREDAGETGRKRLVLSQSAALAVVALDAGIDSAAVALFVERAQSGRASPPLADAGGRGTTAVEVCRRLDGIPLAIELAASRMASMTVSEIRDRLGHRFQLLVGSRRDVPHHQHLRQDGAIVLRPSRRCGYVPDPVFGLRWWVRPPKRLPDCRRSWSARCTACQIASNRRSCHRGRLDFDVGGVRIRQFADQQLLTSGAAEVQKRSPLRKSRTHNHGAVG